MDYCNASLRKLLVGMITSLFLSACTSSIVQTTHYTAVNQAPINTQQMAVSIKHDINNDPHYQTGLKSYQAKEYTEYVNELIGQIKNKKISEDYARVLLLKTYQQFKIDTFNFKKDHLLNDSPPVAPKEPPPQVPGKPGAL